MLKVRTLQRHEREALLELLDLWPLPDGWRGRDFFRRYLEEDPTFEDENVVVGEDSGRLVSCVQIFPRPVRVQGHAVPLGGIGSVFTRPERRGRGIAGRLLEFAAERMRQRGMELSLLFAGLDAMPLYRRLGWRSWGARHLLISRQESSRGDDPPEVERAAFDVARDLEAVRTVYDEYSGRLEGSVVRDDRLWRGSLRVAGNPCEEFRVARRDGRLVAYVRAVVMDAFLVIAELGRRDGAAEALAALVDEILTPREPDSLAPPERPSAELRRSAVLPIRVDTDLVQALGRRGFQSKELENPTVMWRCLDPASLAARLDAARDQDEDAEQFLRGILAPGRFTYWPADRF